MSKENLNIAALKNSLTKFAQEREWQQFHNPKNLAMALSVEAAELMEIFQWLTLEESVQTQNLEAIGEELSDIILYAIRLSTVLNINLEEAVHKKIEANKKKYPVEKCKGSAKKYNQL